MARTLFVTNDFPPRLGGIESFVHALTLRRPADSVIVYCSTPAGAAGSRDAERFDIAQPFPVVRERRHVLLPTPDVARRARNIARAEGCDTVVFGAATPLGLLADSLRRAGVARTVALTHGHETWWAAVPGARRLLRSVGDTVDVVTYLNDFTRGRIASALSPAARRRMRRLTPGVDTSTFHPDAGDGHVRAVFGLGTRPVVVSVSRLVARKGQDTLIDAWPRVRAAHPDARLLIVGDGPHRGPLLALARRRGVLPETLFTGPVLHDQTPAFYAAGDVFAFPCRTRRAGLEIEGLGMTSLEAAASGLPVVVGDSGGAPETVIPGRTGEVTPGRDHRATADHLVALLDDRERAREMGARGRAWVADEWSWRHTASRFDAILADA
ncbi:glycosyltransferase family 4 protein [Spiractinospora alimapuensis]|uniref:glycosyltransferase family 4 protein n=1 Tax=Spiractinospora alimapuensis TaxID=2820884 RepID=UPI001F19E6BB|nr:glycosyltransferase family 4 protein [Spiractinospora alimapuensis]QVQ53228.1 glycosyltransferase family 4 protein [Spiractinospora alimapuensis]